MRTTHAKILTLLLALAAASAASAAEERAVDAIEGLDPVALVGGEEVYGDDAFTVDRGRFRYYFASAANRELFARDPERYEIQMGGLCARMGSTTRGNPDLWAVHDGRVYVFGSPGCREAFLAAPASFLEPEPEPLPTGPEAARRGAELMSRAVEAIGGAGRLDALASYQENATAKDSQGEEFHTSLTLAFPDRMRREREFPGYGTFKQILTPEDAFALSSRGDVRTYSAKERANLEKERTRSVLVLLKSRDKASFAFAGAGEVDGQRVERVAVRYHGTAAVLGVEPESGRVLSLEYTGRGPDGSYGEIVESFSDFRQVDGWTLPFRRTVTWNGEEFAARSAVVTAIRLGPADDALFERPAPSEGP